MAENKVEQDIVKGLGTGDSYLRHNFIQPSNELNPDELFYILRDEVGWAEMFHKGGAVPRLVAMQGSFVRDESGEVVAEPVYRHPADEIPQMVEWTPVVDQIRRLVSEAIGAPLNHAIIQYYRSGQDYIAEHADKTLDIQRGSSVVNVSFGRTRKWVLREKRGFTKNPDRHPQTFALPNNSFFNLGWETNRCMTHEIRQDKRPEALREEDALAFDGQRISLTFRTIGTFLRHSDRKLYGQGATQKDQASVEAYDPPTDEETLVEETRKLIYAFSQENRDPDFDWDKSYSCGFDVMDMKLLDQLEGRYPKETAQSGQAKSS